MLGSYNSGCIGWGIGEQLRRPRRYTPLLIVRPESTSLSSLPLNVADVCSGSWLRKNVLAEPRRVGMSGKASAAIRNLIEAVRLVPVDLSSRSNSPAISL